MKATMVAQTWKPLRWNRCGICKKRFVLGTPGSDTSGRYCGPCMRLLRRRNP